MNKPIIVMKKYYLLLAFLIVTAFTQAQVVVKSIDELTEREIQKLTLSIEAPEMRLPSYDYTSSQEGNEGEIFSGPFKFGKGHEMGIGLKDGVWYREGKRYGWRLKISSSGAYSLNLIFDTLVLPEGVELYIFDEKKTVIMGPINNKNSIGADEFWTDLLPGNAIILELVGNEKELEAVDLNIFKVIHGFIDTFSVGFGQSEPCNIDIDCPVGQPFEEESNAVARLLVADGEGFCSGSMINNTCLDFTPYLLTADHCLDPNTNNWVFRFQYRSPNPRCDGQGGGTNNPAYIYYNGAVVRANRQQTDFALLELNTQPSHPNLSYLGWSRVAAGITNTAGIHHPKGDLMKISIDNNAPIGVGDDIVIDEITYPAGNFLEVDFDIGTVEAGSSGSPLLDNNRRTIGQLLGGNTGNRCLITDGLYGRLDVSWNGGGNAATRLRDWLDPTDTDDQTTNTVPVPSVTGPDRICTANTNFTLQNVPAGQTVTWAVSPTYLFPSTGRTGTGTTASLRASGTSISGSATLTYTVDTDCGEYQVSKAIWVGVPNTTMQVDANYYPICLNEYTYINAFYDPYNNNPAGNKDADITNFIWQQPSGVSCFTAGNRNEVLACRFTTPNTYTVRVRAVNSCGQGGFSECPFQCVRLFILLLEHQSQPRQRQGAHSTYRNAIG